MGDSPSVAYVLRSTRHDPSQPGWGGRFVRVWDDRKTIFERQTTADDKVEAFGIVEFAFPVPPGTRVHSARMIFDDRVPVVGVNEGRVLRFRFSPRDAKLWSYVIRSDFSGLDGVTGRFTAVAASVAKARHVSSRHPDWWTDDPDPAAADGIHAGAQSVSQWRRAFLQDFGSRMERCSQILR